MVRGRGERAEARRPVTGHAAADTTSSLEGRSHRAPVRRRRDLESAKVCRTPGGRGGGHPATTSHRTVPSWVVVSHAGGRGGRGGLAYQRACPRTRASCSRFLLSLGSSTFALALALHNTLARFRKRCLAANGLAGGGRSSAEASVADISKVHMEISGTGPGTGRQGINTQTNMAPRRGD